MSREQGFVGAGLPEISVKTQLSGEPARTEIGSWRILDFGFWIALLRLSPLSLSTIDRLRSPHQLARYPLAKRYARARFLIKGAFVLYW